MYPGSDKGVLDFIKTYCYNSDQIFSVFLGAIFDSTTDSLKKTPFLVMFSDMATLAQMWHDHLTKNRALFYQEVLEKAVRWAWGSID